MEKNYEIIKWENMKNLCYLYGAMNILAPFLITPEMVNTVYSIAISFISTGVFIYIMLKFKLALNRVMHSVKMDRIIGMMVYFSIAGYAMNILALRNPEGMLPYQAMLGLGVTILYIVYGMFLRNLDAPLEKLKQLKSLGLYSNVILVAVAMAFTIIGVLFFILLMGISYFILGNLFKEMKEIEAEAE